MNQRFALTCLSVLILCGLLRPAGGANPRALAQAEHVSTVAGVSHGGWSQLSSPRSICGGSGALYYDFALANGSRAHLVVVDVRKNRWRVRPSVAPAEHQPTSVQAKQCNASAAVNGGYFNLKEGGHSTSYVIANGLVVADPTKNPALMENVKLKPFISRILNRTEVRFMETAAHKPLIQITRHNTAVPAGAKLIDSLQAGPQLLPTLDIVDEAFVRTNVDGSETDSISARKTAARTAFGITNDGYVMMLCVAGQGQDPESSGITLDELASLMRRLGCVQALNLDGGASTTMYARLTPDCEGAKLCGKSPETLVKSVLLLEPRP
jgi:hypothetical protein